MRMQISIYLFGGNHFHMSGGEREGQVGRKFYLFLKFFINIFSHGEEVVRAGLIRIGLQLRVIKTKRTVA